MEKWLKVFWLEVDLNHCYGTPDFRVCRFADFPRRRLKLALDKTGADADCIRVSRDRFG
jgi:hypothetical protein